MDKLEVIEMLKSLIANLDNNHIQIKDVTLEESGSLSALTLVMSGTPRIGRVDG